MKLTFESNLLFQQDAVKSIIDIFEGHPPIEKDKIDNTGEFQNINILNTAGNTLILSEKQILDNLQKVQRKNGIKPSKALDGMHFSVEMETGTGKTYVYLRTIYELFVKYGFKKFIIVVPSIAIREGVLKNLEITHEHFQNLYDNIPVNFQVYNSAKVSSLRSFATVNNIEILVINIDSFAKDENIINRPNDRLNGSEPIKFLQSVRPIVIVDEPQNMETEKRKNAIGNLNPLAALRYSATHQKLYNLTYSLNPVKAYDLGLVKHIEVDSIIEENSANGAFISLDDIVPSKTKIVAKVSIYVNEKHEVKKKRVTVRVGDDLYEKSNRREIYLQGYKINGIDAEYGSIRLSNGQIMYKGETKGGLSDELIKIQIKKTIEEHINKEKQLNHKGIKVLSLFFIDKVANYRGYDDKGNPVKGKFARWFESIYRDIWADYYGKSDSQTLDNIHNGYFSQDKKGKIKDTTGDTKADYDTYSLIMKEKEALLDIKNPLRFIFSHSALREGWDNPNVFQICTLNETRSEMKKRQEIGRGLRLAVDGSGRRIYDRNINRLTIIANESYNDFAKELQKQIEDDFGIEFKDKIKNRADRKQIKYRKGFEADPKFLEIWEKIKQKTTYRVNYDTKDLIKNTSKALVEMPQINAPSIRSTKVSITMSETGVAADYKGENAEEFDGYNWKIPDILGWIQRKTELTRSTIYQILNESGKIADILINPQLFLDQSSAAIKRTLHSMMIDGIKYHKIGDCEYEMTLFEAQELEVYLNDFTFKVKDPSKTIYEEFIPLDSGIESRFAKDCETSEQVKFYFKLPSWFKIPTPIGDYNPDWAVVFEYDKKVYFIAETKDTGTSKVNLHKLPMDQQIKIKCGKAHFDEFDEIEYKTVNRLGQLV